MSRLHVECSGSGPPLILLHGWAMHGGMFAPIVPALSTRFRVSVVDLPGHGRSAAQSPATLDAVVGALRTQFATIGSPLRVLGWSMGAAVALRWAAVMPSRVEQLVLVSATPRFVAGPDWPHAMSAATLARFGDELIVAYRLTLQRFLTLQMQGSDAGRAALQAMRGALFARGEPAPEQLRAGLAMLQAIDLRDDAVRVTAPTLIVSGDRDTLTTAAAGAWLAEAMPAARQVTIAGAAHAPFLSHRDAFDAAVLPFLDGS